MNTLRILRYYDNVKRRFKKIYKRYLAKSSLPDFLIIGAQKCGTTTLYSYLIQHPGIIPAESKEIFYFGNPYNYPRGRAWYASHFCTNSYKNSLCRKLGYMPITGEATPDMHMPFMPKLVHQLLPNVKLIALFRDPVDRAYSQYHHDRRAKRETLDYRNAIDQSIHSIPEETADDPLLYSKIPKRSYIIRGLYDEQLERWFQFYPRNKIHIINSGDFFSNPLSELKKVFNFLKLPDYQLDYSVYENAGKYKEQMDGDTRDYLISIFRPHNRRLFKMIGRDFGWPS